MSAQSSLKARAEAILARSNARTIPAQYKKKAANCPHIAQTIGNLKSADIEKIKAWLNDIGEVDQHIILEKCRREPDALRYFLQLANDHMRDIRAKKAQAMLKAHPDKQRAYLTEIDADSGNVILTIAIRGKATFEMLIPQAKYDAFLLAEMIDKDLIH